MDVGSREVVPKVAEKQSSFSTMALTRFSCHIFKSFQNLQYDISKDYLKKEIQQFIWVFFLFLQFTSIVEKYAAT